MKKYICLIVGISLFNFATYAQSLEECSEAIEFSAEKGRSFLSELEKFLSNENNYYQGRLRTGQTFEDFWENVKDRYKERINNLYVESTKFACSELDQSNLHRIAANILNFHKELDKREKKLRNIFCDSSIKTGASLSDYAYWNSTCLHRIECADERKGWSSWFTTNDLDTEKKLQQCQTFKFKKSLNPEIQF